MTHETDPGSPDLSVLAPQSGSADGVTVPWNEEVDVAVIGFGGAGCAAAVEAAASGARVLVIERFAGGGATRMSGGVLYAGGGTHVQREAGCDDTPEEMFKYLELETRDAVPEQVLRAFCETSVSNLSWVESHGVPYPPGFEPKKTSYPGNDKTLYFSGNENAPPYCHRARPAPRGHRALGKGMTGKVLYEPLRRAALRRGVEVRYRTKARRLITDEEGGVIGVEIRALSRSLLVRGVHALLFGCGTYLGSNSVPILKLCRGLLERLEDRFGTTLRVRTRGGVLIAAGGFIFNSEMTAEHLPKYSKTMRLGTVGADGSGINLARAVGAGVRNMERGSAWMFINPPAAFSKGILVDARGQRICNEELYGGALGERIAELHDGRAILLLDRKSRTQTRDEIFGSREANFQNLLGLINLYLNSRKASSLEALARKYGIPEASLLQTVSRYNAGVEKGVDATGKSSKSLQLIDTPPFYAVNCDLDNARFTTPSMSLGGLSVNGFTGQVLRRDGAPIQGLYAAGRSAVGVCSNSYVSGLSVADGIFSGRNAGSAVAEAAAKSKRTR